MKKVLLIVKKNDDSFHIDGVLTQAQSQKLEQVCLGDSIVSVEFVLEAVKISFNTSNGSLVTLLVG